MRCGWCSASASPIEAVRKISRSLKRDRRAQRAAHGLGEGDDARRLLLRQQDQRELVAGQPRQRVLRLEQPGEPARDGEQDGIADRDADRIVDLLEAVEIDHHAPRPDLRVGAGIGEGRLHAVEEQFAVGQAGEVVVHGVEQQPLLGVLEFGDVGERADQPHHLAVGADHRPRLQREPEIMAVGGAQAEILGEAAAPLLHHAVERGAEAVAVERMQHVEPARGRAFQRAALEAEHVLGFRAGVDLVGGDVPVPDHVAGAGQRQRAPLDVGDDAVGDAAGEGVLHHREADQHHDQHQAAEQRRADDVVGDDAGDGETGARRSTPPAAARSGSAAPRGRSRGWRDRPPAPARTPRCSASDRRAMPEAIAGSNTATPISAASAASQAMVMCM